MSYKIQPDKTNDFTDPVLSRSICSINLIYHQIRWFWRNFWFWCGNWVNCSFLVNLLRFWMYEALINNVQRYVTYVYKIWHELPECFLRWSEISMSKIHDRKTFIAYIVDKLSMWKVIFLYLWLVLFEWVTLINVQLV